jgi:hypothetical protein
LGNIFEGDLMKTQEEILSLLTSGLALASEKYTQEALGDRSAYLGLSTWLWGFSAPGLSGLPNWP